MQVQEFMAPYNKKKLYVRQSDLRIPDSVQETVSGNIINYQTIKVGAFVNWPDSRPCVAVNMYLLANAHEWTGETPVTYASELSELVRYCHGKLKSFSDLTDGDIFALVEHLTSEINPRTGMRKRNNNTACEILHRSLCFLMWYQENLHRGLIPLIGEEKSGPAILVSQKKNDRGNLYWTHRYAPEPNSTDPKLPIDLSIIEAIDTSIEHLSIRENHYEPAMRPFKRNPEFFDSLLSYHYARRRFMIWIMQRTGLRPAEMVGLSLIDNKDVLRKNVLVIPTMKRRKLLPPPRTFAITPKDSRVVMRYFAARGAWIAACAANDPGFAPSDAMFLGVAPGSCGAPISKGGLDRDFRSLCIHAGHKDSEACFSMFRHRFITWEVLSHIRAWEAEKGRPASEQDYRSILEKVRIKTGHADAMSLWHYIDLAQDLAGVWVNVERASARLHAADHLKVDLEELRHDLRSGNVPHMAAEQIASLVLGRLEGIIGDARAAGLG